MELREAQSLIALSEHGSIREAARNCHISPAAVHKHLKTLEGELGVKLYEKREGRLALTEAGRIALPYVKEMLLHHDAAVHAIGEWKNGERGAVRVGAGPSFSSYVLPPLLKRFRRRFPRVDVYVETGDSSHLISRLKSGALDLIFDLSAAALPDRNLELVAQWEAQTGFVSARADVPPRCRLHVLQNVPFILFGKGTIMESAVQNYFDSLNFCPAVVMRSDSAEAIKAMIRTGLGVSVLFLWNLDSDPRSSMLSLVRTDAPPLSLRMGLIRMRASYTPRAVLKFVELAARVNSKHLRLATLGRPAHFSVHKA